MRYRRLGKTDLEISVIGFGGWAIVGGFNWGRQDPSDSVRALRAAYEAGINFFDTAELYGEGLSEELIARALASVRDDILIAGKVSTRNYAPDRLVRACEQSLRRLNTDRIDLYQLHWPAREIPISPTLDALDRLRDQGKIRFWGVSNFGVEDMGAVRATGRRIESNQLAYSLLFRAVEYEILPACAREETSVLCYSPLAQGLLTGKFASIEDVPIERRRTRHFAGTHPHARHGEPGAEAETFAAVADIRTLAAEARQSMGSVALAWLLAQPGVASVLAGVRNAEQARENARAGDLDLPASLVQRLSAATEPLKQKLGRNPDLWETPPRIR